MKITATQKGRAKEMGYAHAHTYPSGAELWQRGDSRKQYIMLVALDYCESVICYLDEPPPLPIKKS